MIATIATDHEHHTTFHHQLPRLHQCAADSPRRPLA
jgi:hypothetical protein